MKILVLMIVFAGALACGDSRVVEAPTAAPPSLAQHSAEFERGVVEVTDGVHVAIGFGLANSILVEGDDGVIVVDTMESLETAREVREAFREITTKPVAAIVFTHNHTDHVFGSPAFAEENGPPPPVYAHETTASQIDRIVNVIRPAIYRRSMRMFGNYLPREAVLNAGIGPFLATGHGGGTLGLLRPSVTFAERLEVEVAGVSMELVHARGETDDQLFVWLPQKRVLMPGDNFYRAFPNLYTIRGTPYRDVLAWVRSIDAMRALRPEYLVPSHTRPISGADRVYEALTDYRDAIQFVHDQTVRGINLGLGPDEIAATLELPAHLAGSPFLQEFYGTVEWSVRSIFSGYLGWFDGNAAHLSPLPPRERAQRMAALAAGGATLTEAAALALEADDPRWAAELADLALEGDAGNGEARRVLAAALRRMGERHPSANGRHYYLTQALEVEGAVEIGEPDPTAFPTELVHGFPISGILAAMAVALDPERAADVDTVVGFRFPDVDEDYTIHVRHGVAEVQPVAPAEPDVALTVDSNVWKDLLTGRRNAALTFASDAVEIDGSTLDLLAFLRLFRREG